MTLTSSSDELFTRAKKVSPGGVHGAARYYAPHPRFFTRAEGKYMWDVEGRQFLDLHNAWGTAALGYNHPAVRAMVIEVLENEGVLLGAPSRREVELSEKLSSLIPCAEMVALFGGGGSDALYVGFRLARAVTGRARLLKFEGEYHGWHDTLGVSVHPRPELAGPSERPLPVPISAGAAEGATSAVIGVLNDEALLERLFEEHGHELACAVTAPVNHSTGCIPLEASFLQRLRNLCDEYGVVLMFDEILTGFRHSIHGAQDLVGVIPDLAAFGKALANSYPISALVGKRELMTHLSPSGQAFYSGTFCAQIFSVAAAQATLNIYETDDVQKRTFELTRLIADAINRAAEEDEIVAVCQSWGAAYCPYFGLTQVRNYRDVAAFMFDETFQLNSEFQRHLLSAGIFMHPYRVNRSFVSAALEQADAERVADVTVDFMKKHREKINASARTAALV
jgi:glutamate-1-semialdehyde 2,1-aminomutase